MTQDTGRIREQMASTRCSISEKLDLLERRGILRERLTDPLLAGELGDDRASPAAGRKQPERCGHRRLADPAFAGDEDQATLEQSAHSGADVSYSDWSRVGPPSKGFPVTPANYRRV